MNTYIKITLAFIIFPIYSITGQVGISNNNPNKDAVLDLNSTNGSQTKGLLMPQVSLSSTDAASPLSIHVAGMHVYNTVTTGSGSNQVTPGEYYNDGLGWVKIQSNGWGLRGNANTTASNFLGTTDAVDLILRTNNTEKMRIPSTGKVLLGTTTVPTGGSNTKVIINNNTTAGSIQIKDGSEGSNYVLTSDVNGVAKWKPQTLEVFFSQTYGAGSNMPATPAGQWYYTGTFITLPPGKWLITLTMLLTKGSGNWTTAGESWWVSSSFSNSSTSLSSSSDIVNGVFISGSLPSNSLFNVLNGSTIINNVTGANKTYYYIGKVSQAYGASGQLQGFGGNWAENSISWKAID